MRDAIAIYRADFPQKDVRMGKPGFERVLRSDFELSGKFPNRIGKSNFWPFVFLIKFYEPCCKLAQNAYKLDPSGGLARTSEDMMAGMSFADKVHIMKYLQEMIYP